MEGVACALARDLTLFRRLGTTIEGLHCGGGATQNALWSRIKADVLNVPLSISDEPEAGLQGAALLGAAGVGLIGDLVAAAGSRVTFREQLEPDPAQVEAYRTCTRRFERIYDHLLGFWQGDGGGGVTQ